MCMHTRATAPCSTLARTHTHTHTYIYIYIYTYIYDVAEAHCYIVVIGRTDRE